MEGTTYIEGLVISPVPFVGSPDESRVNYESHKFVSAGYDGGYCDRCGTELHEERSFYACGTEVPHQVTLFLEDGRTEIHQLPPNYSWDDINNIERKYQ